MPSFSTAHPYSEDYVPACLKDIVDHLAADDLAKQIGPDEFPLFKDTDHTWAHRKLNSYLKKPDAPEDVIAAVAPADQWELLRAILIRIFWWRRTTPRLKKNWQGIGDMWVIDSNEHRVALSKLAEALLRKWAKGNMPKVKPAVIAEVLKEFGGPRGDDLVSDLGGPELILPVVEKHVLAEGMSTGVRQGLAHFREMFQYWSHRADYRKLKARIDELLGEGPAEPVDRGEAWSDAAIVDLEKLKSRGHWNALLSHCLSATSSKPTGKWLKEAARLTDAIGADEFTRHVSRWFPLVNEPRTQTKQAKSEHSGDPNLLISDRNELVLRGLAWACAHHPSADITRALSTLSEISFKKIKWVGPRCPKVGNACLWALANTEGDDAVSRLSTLAAKVKQPTARKMIGRALGASAERHGKSVEELEESALSDFGLGGDGSLNRAIGKYTVGLRLDGTHSVSMDFKDAKGATRAAVPADIKQSSDFKELQKLSKDISAALVSVRHRLETSLAAARQWSFADFQRYYIDHRLAGALGRKLIWELLNGDTTTPFIWHNGQFIAADTRKVELPKNTSDLRIRLWHPITSPPDTVLAWRRFLEEHQITQPFKQAHREIYIITDAERRTRTYSNRFAAHLLRQHQLRALCLERGWKYDLQGSWDGSHQDRPTLQLPQLGLSVTYNVYPAPDSDESYTGVALIVTTDDLRFNGIQGGPVALADVPPMAFSEVLRDVDLFVGVCSIGTDPEWHDRGDYLAENFQNANYWQDYAFGDLDAAANIRRDLLSRLLPRLKIADRCRLDDRHLVVTGDLRVYKIHLRSGNILMEPNNAYLCIVPSSKNIARQEVLLPFEGDAMLSLIISKAFLLAEDTKITDRSILSQIKGR